MMGYWRTIELNYQDAKNIPSIPILLGIHKKPQVLALDCHLSISSIVYVFKQTTHPKPTTARTSKASH